MGQVHAAPERAPSPRLNPEINPDPLNDPTFPPNYGFVERRKRRAVRQSFATKEELQSARVPMENRDFCAHKFIEFKNCARQAAPWTYLCHHEKHEYEDCLIDDYIIRQKEFERERRLLVRNARKDRLVKLKQERLEQLAKFGNGNGHEAADADMS